ncbi:MAG TPA: ETC complex I subunit [Propylenella sp.]|nr:ETC complex I subunit [Propylenella sp.]
MVARIYRPAKTAMSSGHANAQQWRLEFEPERAKTIEPLMGYTSSDDMNSQIRLEFDSKEAAIAYAERNGIPYQVFEPKDKARPAISYSDNFRRDRRQPWTH